MSIKAQMHKPAVLIAIGAIVLVFLYLASRGKSAGGTPQDYSLSSQQIAAQTNVSLGAQTTQYNIAALGYQAALANNAAQLATAGVDSSTAITLQSLSNLDNINTAGAMLNKESIDARTGITLNAQNNNAYLDAARINANTQITLAPIAASLQRDLSTTAANENISLAQVNTSAATTIAALNNASRERVANTQSATTLGKAGIDNFGNIVSGIGSLATLFAAA